MAQSRLERAAAEIARAQDAVAKAQLAHGHGGSVDAVNKANRRLSDAHEHYRETSGGNVPDDR